MFKNHFNLLVRNASRGRSFFAINIAGLAVGIACCLFILLWVQDELSFDRFHERRDNIFRITSWWEKNGWDGLEATPEPLAPAIKGGIPEVIEAVRFASHQRLVFRYEDRAFYEDRGVIADPALFRVFSFPFVRGTPETAFSSATDIVMTETLARKYFGDQDPLGKVIQIEGRLATVTGVIADPPRTSSLRFDFVSSFDFIKELSGWGTGWHAYNYATFVLLQERRDLEDTARRITQIALDNESYQVSKGLHFKLQPLARIHLDARPYQISWVALGDSNHVFLFSAIAVFILLIACVNFMNLSTARSALRLKEIAMRKTMGANRARLIRQFLGESLFYAGLSGAIALVLVAVLLPVFRTVSGKDLGLDFSSPVVLLGIPAILLFAGLAAGSYPALYLSGFHPVAVLRKAAGLRSRGAGFRRILVVSQFSLSIILILATLVIHRQLHYVRNTNLGFNRDNIIYLPLKENIGKRYAAFKEALLSEPDVLSVTAHSYNFATSVNRAAGWDWEGADPEQGAELDLILSGVDFDFFKTLDLEIVDGRAFSREFSTDPKQAYIINEAAAEAMRMEDPVGKGFVVPKREGRIIGVVKDAHLRSMRWSIAPRLFYMADMPDIAGSGIVLIKIAGSRTVETLKSLERTWSGFNPVSPFEFRFLDETYDELYRREERTVMIFNVFTVLALVISCLGLFGLAVFMTERRTKEIGIRKVLGAETGAIVRMLSLEFMKWVLMANIFAWPLGYFAARRLLEGYAYRASVGPELFALSGAVAALIALLTVMTRSYRAAAADPAASLRYE